MKKLIIIGAGGFAREVVWLVNEINKKKEEWNLLGYVEYDENKGKVINEYPILGDVNWLNSLNEEVYIIIAIGDGKARENIMKSLNNKIKIATLIHPDILIDKTNKIGEGCILCRGSVVTVNINIGKHVIINIDSTVGHDTELKDYTTILPGSHISGNVIIGEKTTIGTGAVIIEKIVIGKETMVGAGAVIVRDIDNNCTVVGNPGRVIKYKKN